MHNRSVPTSTMLAHLCYRDLVEASDWLARVFGFNEYYRYGQPVSGVQMCLGDAHIMLVVLARAARNPSRTRMWNANAHGLCSRCPGALRQHQAPRRNDLEQLQETVYGELQYGVTDIDGHRWLFSQHARDVDPASWGATVVSPPPTPLK